MKKNKELLCWGSLIFLIQLVMILLQANHRLHDPILDLVVQGYGKLEDVFPFEPLSYLYGKGYDGSGFQGLEQHMWLMNIALYCVMVIGKMTQYKEEYSYMIISRYKSFREYYRMVYFCFLKYTFVYQISLFLGALAGAMILQVTENTVSCQLFLVIMAQISLLIGNLFWGIFVLYFILHKNQWKWSMLIYPCVPIISLFIGEDLPARISNLFPGSWMMLARSNLMVAEGFSFWGVLLIEGFVFFIMSKLVLK